MKFAKKGMIETGVILTLVIVLMMLPLSLTILKYCANFHYDYQMIMDELVADKLRRILLLSYDQEFGDNYLNFTYQNKRFSLLQKGDRLVLSDGYQIVLDDIENVRFIKEDGCLILSYKRGNKEYEKVIKKQEGLYIDDFYLPTCGDSDIA